MKIKELLSDESKWCKGSPTNADGTRICLVEAILRCYGDEKEIYEREKVFDRIERELNITNSSIQEWNDHPQTTFQNVKELIEKLNI